MECAGEGSVQGECVGGVCRWSVQGECAGEGSVQGECVGGVCR